MRINTFDALIRQQLQANGGYFWLPHPFSILVGAVG